MVKYKILRKDNLSNDESYLINYFEKKDSAETYVTIMNSIFEKEEKPLFTYQVVEVDE